MNNARSGKYSWVLSFLFSFLLCLLCVYHPRIPQCLARSKQSDATIKRNTDWAGVVVWVILWFEQWEPKRKSTSKKQCRSRKWEERGDKLPEKETLHCHSHLPLCSGEIVLSKVWRRKCNASCPAGSGTSWHCTTSSHPHSRLLASQPRLTVALLAMKPPLVQQKNPNHCFPQAG